MTVSISTLFGSDCININSLWRISVAEIFFFRCIILTLYDFHNCINLDTFEYGEILRISPYSVRMSENMDQDNSEYGHFYRSFIFTRVSFSLKSCFGMDMRKTVLNAEEQKSECWPFSSVVMLDSNYY